MGDRARLILASRSPRRRDLLAHIGLSCEVIPSDVDEDGVGAETPRALAAKLALLKATDVASRLEPPAVVVGADTVVALEGEVFGKPRDLADAERMLRALHGRTHSVITALAVAEAGGQCLVDARATEVRMREFSDAELAAYLATGEPMDKAGAYAIQGRGGELIASHSGCWCNVVGLPLICLLRLLEGSVDLSAHPVPCACEEWPHRSSGPPPWEK